MGGLVYRHRDVRAGIEGEVSSVFRQWGPSSLSDEVYGSDVHSRGPERVGERGTETGRELKDGFRNAPTLTKEENRNTNPSPY